MRYKQPAQYMTNVSASVAAVMKPAGFENGQGIITAAYLKDEDAIWNRVGQSGSWDYMDSIARCGVAYLRTGDERYLALYKRELNRFIDTDVFHPNLEAPPQLHGRLYVLLVVLWWWMHNAGDFR